MKQSRDYKPLSGASSKVSMEVKQFIARTTGVVLMACASTAPLAAQFSYSAPAVSLQGVTPNAVQVGSSLTTLTLAGKNFTSLSVARWNGTTLTTHFVSSTQLTADVPAGLTSTPSTYPISVRDTSETPYTLVSNSLPVVVWYSDVSPTNPSYRPVNAATSKGITGGCGNGNFCPITVIPRDQMAVFLLKAEHGSSWNPPACAGIFADVPCPSSFAGWVEALYNEGVTAGCQTSPLKYCPSNPTARQQMAVFLLKARFKRVDAPSTYAPPAATGIFSDVPLANQFVAWVEDAYNRSIVPSCQQSPLGYCPLGNVTRADMAQFESSAWGFSLGATLSGDDPNFHLAGAYAGSVVKVPDAFSVFATAGFDRFQYVNGQWIDFITSTCPKDPHTITDDRCGDAIFLIWKHVSCVQPPPNDGYIPCATNDRYNMYNGLNNHVAGLDPNNWPPPGLDRQISAKNLNAVLPAVTIGNESTCRPSNPGDYPAGASLPQVIYVGSPVNKYLMAFNGNVHFELGGITQDNWRLLWASSIDGSTWTVTPNNYLFRHYREALDCESGLQAQALAYDNGYVYLLVGAIDQLLNSQFARAHSNSYYLLRAPVTAASPYYGQWQIASGLDTAGAFMWTNVTAGGTIDVETIGYKMFDGERAYSTSAGFAKVATQQGGYRWIFVSRRQNDSDLNLWSTPSLSLPPTSAGVVSNATGLSPALYGWMFDFTTAGKDLPASDDDLANPVPVWIDSYTSSGRQDYRKVTMTLCGLPPYGGC